MFNRVRTYAFETLFSISLDVSCIVYSILTNFDMQLLIIDIQTRKSCIYQNSPLPRLEDNVYPVVAEIPGIAWEGRVGTVHVHSIAAINSVA
jgi:hypothetical protein